NPLGLHARAAARFVQIAGRFASRIQVTRGGRTVDGKSILGLLLLAAAKGSEIDVAVEGDDEEAALDAIGGLIARGFEAP
ncbi:MAG TPA: HPr family phosphocarrier protein, partial [Vicinamibacterales bacterium]